MLYFDVFTLFYFRAKVLLFIGAEVIWPYRTY